MSAQIDTLAADSLARLADRAEIHEATLRYCRGIDRFDPELVLTSHHPDAYDDYGLFAGTVAQFVDFIFPLLAENYLRTSHILFNQLIDFADTDIALVETYMMTVQIKRVAEQEVQVTAYGRYLDRFERRAGRWAIAHRTCVTDTARTDPVPAWAGASSLDTMYRGSRDSQDPLYRQLGVGRLTPDAVG